MSRIVVALGGNALGNTYIEQQELVREASKELVKLFPNNEIVIAHGNGPQVGMITKAFAGDDINMPLDCCTAMSEGYIGFHIQKNLRKEMIKQGVNRNIVTLITEVVVDKNDSSFGNPTKPIGKFYTKEEADKLSKETNDIYKEDANRGYRKVVASPKPVDILNVDSVLDLVAKGTIVVAAGGGGIPVFNSDEEKVEAVIDKDFASALLAEKINADKFIILTAVDQAKINFGTDNEQALSNITIEEAQNYIEAKEFKEGSMLPKVEACIEFTKKTGNDSIITSLSNIKGIIENNNITTITK